MKKALIDGTRICEIVDTGHEFEVHSSLIWVTVPDETTTKDSWVDNAVVTYSVSYTMDDLRVERNQKLIESDWTQVDDSPVDKAAWATYRQALRDLPANTPDINNVTWPTEPGE
jgi:hypothetical protein